MRRVSLALQGGGAHGAFTWGVLDRLKAAGRAAAERFLTDGGAKIGIEGSTDLPGVLSQGGHAG